VDRLLTLDRHILHLLLKDGFGENRLKQGYIQPPHCPVFLLIAIVGWYHGKQTKILVWIAYSCGLDQ
jgi:hypothetical protein